MLRNYDVDSAVALGAGSSNGTAVSVDKNLNGFVLQAVVSSSSSPVGTFKLQAAIDTGGTPTNWADISGTTAAITADGVTMWAVGRHNFKWVRIVWTKTSGTGNYTSTFNENT